MLFDPVRMLIHRFLEAVGWGVGRLVGLDVGLEVGRLVGLDVGLEVGRLVGLDVGLEVGRLVGLEVGGFVAAHPHTRTSSLYELSSTRTKVPDLSQWLYFGSTGPAAHLL